MNVMRVADETSTVDEETWGWTKSVRLMPAVDAAGTAERVAYSLLSIVDDHPLTRGLLLSHDQRGSAETSDEHPPARLVYFQNFSGRGDSDAWVFPDSDHYAVNYARLVRRTFETAPGSAAGSDVPVPEQDGSKLSRSLSPAFWRRTMKFVSAGSDWDGADAEPITLETAQQAIRLATAMLRVASEPFIAPGVDGSILLQWTLPDGRLVDVYVEPDEGFPDFAMVARESDVREVELTNLRSLRKTLSPAQNHPR